jgi:hypothetical protein
MTQQHKEHTMSKTDHYTRIVFNRTDLFEVCKVGFVAQRIGTLWCEGYVLSDRLSQLDVAYRVD